MMSPRLFIGRTINYQSTPSAQMYKIRKSCIIYHHSLKICISIDWLNIWTYAHLSSNLLFLSILLRVLSSFNPPLWETLSHFHPLNVFSFKLISITLPMNLNRFYDYFPDFFSHSFKMLMSTLWIVAWSRIAFHTRKLNQTSRLASCFYFSNYEK
jgi:hypothetical protein